MGYLYYGTNNHPVELDDRPLSHLKIALLTLLRAGKSVSFSFTRPTRAGSGRETLWISPSTEIRFLFAGTRPPTVNELWVWQIMETADSPTGMRMLPEPVAGDLLRAY